MKEFKLDNEPKITSGFTFPDTYFDDLESKVIERLREKETPIYSLFTKRKIALFAIAAVFIIALSIPLVNLMNVKTVEVDDVVLENYLTQQADISDDDIAELLNEETINHIKIDVKIDNSELEDILISNPEMEEYLN
jgi:hypothetical protein